MASPPPINEQDYELLSAYLDGQLSAPERSALDERLAAEPQLRAALDGLRETVHILKIAPTVALPRSFVLDAKSARLRHLPWWARTGVLELTGALGAAASVLIIVLGLVLGGAPNQQQSAASAPYAANIVANAVVKTNPTSLVALLPSPTATGTQVSDALADKAAAANAAEVATENANGATGGSGGDLGGLSGAVPATASSVPVLKDQASGAIDQSFAANPTTAPIPMSASSGGIALGAAAPQPGAPAGSSVSSAANVAPPSVESSSGDEQTSVSMLAVASPTVTEALQAAGQAAGQVQNQDGSPINSPAFTPTAIALTAEQAQQAQAATPIAQPEQPRAARVVPTTAATVEQQALLATNTPAPSGVVSAKLGLNTPGAPQAVLIVGFVLLVLSGMLFGLGRMRSRL